MPFASTCTCRASGRRCSLPFDALFVPDELREAVSDRAWVQAMLDAELALAVAEARLGLIPEAAAAAVAAACRAELYDAVELARQGRSVGNPAEPLVRALRERAGEHVHHGATSQDMVDTAAALVSRRALELVLADIDGLARACGRLAAEHRDTVMAARTLLQQATPTTFGLKAAGWLTAVLDARGALVDAELPAQLGGAAGTLAALGDRGLDVARVYAGELGLREPDLPWHTNRVPVARLGAALEVAAGVAAKIALDIVLLAQTEVAEVREAASGGSSTMPHKRNPVGSVLARACAARAQPAAGVLTGSLVQEHERAAGAWQAEWGALSDALAFGGAAVAWLRVALEGLQVDRERMRANLRDETMSEARRLGFEGAPEDYLGSADALIGRALGRLERELG